MQMRTVKDAIKDSLDFKEQLKGRNMVWEHFLMNVADLILLNANKLVSNDFPEAKVGGEVVGGGKAVDEEIPLNTMMVMQHRDLIRSNQLYKMLRGFFDWWLEQDAERYNDFSDDPFMWYDRPGLASAIIDYQLVDQRDEDEGIEDA